MQSRDYYNAMYGAGSSLSMWGGGYWRGEVYSQGVSGVAFYHRERSRLELLELLLSDESGIHSHRMNTFQELFDTFKDV